MKSSESVISAAVFAQHRKLSLSAIIAFTKQRTVNFRKRMSKGKIQLKICRMEYVLQSLTDEQLKKAGLDRRDVRRHAEYLINYKYDGL